MNRTQLVLACTLASLTTTTCMANMLYSQSFEETTWLGSEYFDYGDPSIDHWLKNNSGQATVRGDGFNAWYSSTGSVGLSDGDFVGVTNNVRETGAIFDGLNAYQLSDTDGVMSLIFDDYGKDVSVSLAIFIANTGYENADSLTISYGTDVVLSLGNGTDGGRALENAAGSWIFLEASQVSGQLSIAFSSNSGAESVFIDSVSIFNGVPAPGAVSLLGIAGVIGARRRR